MSVNYYVNMQDLTEIESALGMTKDKTKMAMRTAINTTAKEVMQQLIKGAYEEYVTYKSNISRKTTLKKARVSDMIATVTAKGPQMELFSARANPNFALGQTTPTTVSRTGSRPNWYKARAKRSSALKSIALKPGATGDKYKAFVIKFQSGHVTLAQRVPGKKMKSKPEKEFVKKLLAPSYPKIMGGESGVYKKLEPEINSMLMKNLNEQINRYLSK